MKTKSLGRIFLSQIFVFLFTTLILTCFIGLFCISSAEPPPKKESISADTNASAASDKTDITIVWVLSGGFAFCVIAGGISMIVVRANEKKRGHFPKDDVGFMAYRQAVKEDKAERKPKSKE